VSIEKSPKFFVEPVAQQSFRGGFDLMLPLEAG
jgi:hypothetical protein